MEANADKFTHQRGSWRVVSLKLLTPEGEEAAHSFPAWRLPGLHALAQAPSSSKTAIGSLFEADPNYLVQTEPHSAFVPRSLGFPVCGKEGPGSTSLPQLPLLFWKIFCRLAERQ